MIEKLEAGDDARLAPLYAAHRRNGVFFNPWAPFPHTLINLVRFWIRPGLRGAQRRIEPAQRLPALGAGGASITFVGHCTFVIREAGATLVTDPHWGPRAKSKSRKTAPGLALDQVPEDSLALVSHAHYDHLDRYTVRRLPSSTRWVAPLGLAEWLRRAGRQRVLELDWWERTAIGPWRVTCLPAQHWSLRLGTRRNRTLWCSWLVESPGRRYYFSGDSGYFDGFREFGRRFGPIDVAFLPIATYLPRRHLSYQHMDPGEAYRALDDLGAETLVPMHWGTFQMGWDPVHEAPRELFRRIAEIGGDPGRVRVLDIGESWVLSDRR
jgi:N-acyl-phosphatidylethanolamine-hydrolysing phospholipase D